MGGKRQTIKDKIIYDGQRIDRQPQQRVRLISKHMRIDERPFRTSLPDTVQTFKLLVLPLPL
jgi:hypothetical protein